MINFDFSKKCYSCAACADLCPKGAISLDARLFPIVDSKRCVHCNLCEKNCIALNHKTDSLQCQWSACIAKNTDDLTRKHSSSGGIFILLAQYVLEIGGYVCGCVYDERFMTKHIVTDNLDICKKMMGSKYIKSDMSGCISEMNRLVRLGKTVLFSGTPCQVSAVKKCIKSERLLTLAVVCHGSIERDIWEKYLEEEKNMYGNIASLTMRDKSKGYLNYGLKIAFEDGTERITYKNQECYFLKSFTDGLLTRERCLNCKFKGTNIESDLLIGDAWGMEQIYPSFADELGCSALIILNKAGEELFHNIISYIDFKNVDCGVIVSRNKRIVSSTPENPQRKSFKKKAQKSNADIHSLTKRYAKPTIVNRVRWKIYSIFK